MSGAEVISLAARRAERVGRAETDELMAAARDVGMTHAEYVAFLEAALAWFEKRRAAVDAEIARLHAHRTGMATVATQIESRLGRGKAEA